MASKACPVVLVEDNPLTVVGIRTRRRCPIATVSAGDVRLTNQAVVLCTRRHTRNIPTRTGVAVPVTDGVDLDEVILRTHHEHVSVVSIRQEVVRLVRFSQDGWIG